jgi:hypothetical protein
MKIHEFNHLRTILTSLNDSADLTCVSNGIGAVWTRRNSPFKSHQNVDFMSGSIHQKADWQYSLHSLALLCCNGKYDCAVNIPPERFPLDLSGPDGMSVLRYTDESHELHEVGLPAHLIPARLKECMEITLGQRLAGIVFFTFPMGKVSFWKTDGKPVFVSSPVTCNDWNDLPHEYRRAMLATADCPEARGETSCRSDWGELQDDCRSKVYDFFSSHEYAWDEKGNPTEKVSPEKTTAEKIAAEEDLTIEDVTS